jgi:hypothetical protein
VSHSPDPESLPSSAPDRPAELGARARSAVTVLWCSFIIASAATMFFFALIDPAPIASAALPEGLVASRTTFYSLGFLFFWIIGAAAAGLTAWMRTAK